MIRGSVAVYPFISGSRLSTVLGILTAWAMTLGSTTGAAQASDPLIVRGPEDASFSVPVDESRGYATVRHQVLRELGWAVELDEEVLRAQLGSDGPVVEFLLGSPLFWWEQELLQLVSAPYTADGSVQIPLQFLIDFLPARASEAYAFSTDEGALDVLDASLWPQGGTDSRTGLGQPGGISPRRGLADPSDDPSSIDPGVTSVTSSTSVLTPPPDVEEAQNLEKRVIVIDPGHGGTDPGATGAGGRREKDIALTIARYLERELSGEENFEVYLTRDRDVLVPLLERGPKATELKGDRHGLFLSIHVNANEGPAIRGFETYFLSEARTEDERRVAAMENAPLELEAGLDLSDGGDLDLSSISRALRNLDHQHWSSLLAEGIQGELEEVHPGPNRGVKQGPFAVITNALMPAVLVEVGFISNREEERVLSQVQFQREIAGALAQAVRDFFQRYPPEQGATVQGGPPR